MLQSDNTTLASTIPSQRLDALSMVFSAVFLLEAAIKIIAHGLVPRPLPRDLQTETDRDRQRQRQRQR
eukprot:2046704-Rhodomonas_salina.1